MPATSSNSSSSKSGRESSSKSVVSSASVSKECEPGKKKEPLKKDLIFYNVLLFFLCQIGNLPMAGTLLYPSYFKPSNADCDIILNSTYPKDGILPNVPNVPWFYSNLVEWGMVCTPEGNTIKTLTSSVSMAGAAVGSFGSGQVADRLGRKLATVLASGIVTFGNFGQAIIIPYGTYPSLVLTFISSCGANAFMVSSVTLMVEAFTKARSRMFSVCLNFFSLGISYCAIVHYLSQHYYYYFIANGLTSLITGLLIQFYSYESVLWLLSVQKQEEAEIVKSKMDKMNGWFNRICPDMFHIENIKDTYGLPPPAEKKTKKAKKTLVDLVRYKSVLVPLLALSYCYLTTACVSFGFYFGVSLIPGNMFRNMAMMGVLKFFFGFVPYPISFCLGRKPILTISTTIAGILAWSYICIKWAADPGPIFMAIIGLLLTSMLDPIWRIIHLLSAELFPTVVRNMARAICNCVGRLGALMAPFIVHSAATAPLLPVTIFSIMLTVMLCIEIIFFPETGNRPMPENIPEEEEAGLLQKNDEEKGKESEDEDSGEEKEDEDESNNE